MLVTITSFDWNGETVAHIQSLLDSGALSSVLPNPFSVSTEDATPFEWNKRSSSTVHQAAAQVVDRTSRYFLLLLLLFSVSYFVASQTRWRPLLIPFGRGLISKDLLSFLLRLR